MATNKVKCPVCGADLDLVPVPEKEGRVQGLCGHGAGTPVPVYETDAPKSTTVAPAKVDDNKKEK